MLTLDLLEVKLNQINNDIWNFNKLSSIKNLYEEIKKQVPGFPHISEKTFQKNPIEAARNLLSRYAVYLYHQRLEEKGVNREEELQKLHAYLYDKNWNEFYQMVQLEHVEQSSTKRPKFVSPEKIIYNLKGYDDGVDISPPSNSEIGAPLELNKGAPIGYVINLPPGEIKGIQVSAYGGFNKEDRKKRLFTPGDTGPEERALLANGIAIVELNLVDFIKLDSQFDMTKSFHRELHASINHFWETLKNHPEQLSPTLQKLKDKPIVFRGASFGGRTAIRHAELYPTSYDGYISFDGAIVLKSLRESDKSLVSAGGRSYTESDLDPASHIQDLSDHILLIHNANDNNVNLKVSLDFYDKAKKEGKENLLSVHINHKGNDYQKNEGVWNTGHFTPDSNSIEFENQVNAVSNFIIHGPDKLHELTEWRMLKYNSISDRNYNLAKASDLFVEYVNRSYQKEIPDHEKLSKIFSVFELVSKENSDFIRTVFNSFIPTSELEAGLKSELARINAYLKEKYNIEFNLKITPMMLKIYTKSIYNADAKLHRELLLTFILANPDYVDRIHNHIAQKSDYEDVKREAFLKLIRQRSAFRSVSKLTLRGMLERGLQYEKELEAQIKIRNVKALRDLIENYNQSGNYKTLTERLDRVLKQVPEDIKRDMINKVGNEIIADLSIREEIFQALRNQMTTDDYQNLLADSQSSVNQMMSGWITNTQTERLTSILKDVRPEIKRGFVSIQFLRNATLEQLSKVLSNFSNDEVYDLFNRVDGKVTPLAESHDISFLRYVKERVGEERFKKLLAFEVGEGVKGSILGIYSSDNNIESFNFLIAHLSTDELIEHIQNNKNTSSYDDNLIVNMLAAGNLQYFEALGSRFQADGKGDLLRTLILDTDKNNQSGLSFSFELSANNPQMYQGLLEQTLKLCTSEDVASELKSKNSKLVHFIQFANRYPEMNRRLGLVKDKLGDTLYQEVVDAQAQEIVRAMISDGGEPFKRDVEKLLGRDKIKLVLENSLDEMFSSYGLSKDSINLVREYYSKEDLNQKLPRYLANSIKQKMNSSWYSAGSISEILNCLEPKDYAEFQRQLHSEPDSLATYFKPEKIQSIHSWQDKIKELLSAPDEMLPHIFPMEILRMILDAKDVSFQAALKDINRGHNLSVIEKIITKSDDSIVKFILSPTPSQLASALRWKNESDQNFIISLVLGSSSEVKKELISVDVLKSINHPSTLSRLLDSFSNDEVYDLFSRVDGNKTALAMSHDISFLRYVKDRVGEERFKKLLEFKVGEGVKGSILGSYSSEKNVESFNFLIAHLSTDELIEHIQNNKNTSSYGDNLIVNILAAGKLQHFEALASRLLSDGKADLLRTLILDTDKHNQSGLNFAVELSSNNIEDYLGLLESVFKFCTAEDLAIELKSENSKLSHMMRYSSRHPEMNRRLNLIKDKLGEQLFKEVVEANSKDIIKEMIDDIDEQFERDVVRLLGVEKVKQCVDEHLDELISSYSVSKNKFDLIRKYCSRADLGEKLAKGCTESLISKMESSWYSSGSITTILQSLSTKEYEEFQKQLHSEPHSLAAYFKPEKIQSIDKWHDKINELLSAPDSMVPVIFSAPVLKSILATNLQGTIISLHNSSTSAEMELSRLLDMMYLTDINRHVTNYILNPTPDSLKIIISNGVEPSDAFEFCWKNIVFSVLTPDEIKASLTSDLLTMISHPQMLLDAVQKLTDEEVFELFNQEDCKAVLNQYPEEMLKVVAERVGDKYYRVLTQNQIEERSVAVTRMTQMFERSKDNQSKGSADQGDVPKEEPKSRKKL